MIDVHPVSKIRNKAKLIKINAVWYVVRTQTGKTLPKKKKKISLVMTHRSPRDCSSRSKEN